MEEFTFPKPELGAEYEEPYPHLLALTRGGMALRFALWPHKDPSTTRGRMFGKLKGDDEFIAVFKVYAEDPVTVVTRSGRALTCLAGEINLLAGPGTGVIMIKLAEGDEVIAGFPAHLHVSVEKSTGAVARVDGGEPSARGGRGVELIKRGAIKRVIWPEPVVPSLGGEDPEADKADKKGKR
jgi:DNA gyrase subunit A